MCGYIHIASKCGSRHDGLNRFETLNIWCFRTSMYGVETWRSETLWCINIWHLKRWYMAWRQGFLKRFKTLIYGVSKRRNMVFVVLFATAHKYACIRSHTHTHICNGHVTCPSSSCGKSMFYFQIFGPSTHVPICKISWYLVAVLQVSMACIYIYIYIYIYKYIYIYIFPMYVCVCVGLDKLGQRQNL
jgi:hypothetical protein